MTVDWYLFLNWAPSVSGAGRVGSGSFVEGVSVAASRTCFKTITFSNMVSSGSSSLHSFCRKQTNQSHEGIKETS